MLFKLLGKLGYTPLQITEDNVKVTYQMIKQIGGNSVWNVQFMFSSFPFSLYVNLILKSL